MTPFPKTLLALVAALSWATAAAAHTPLCACYDNGDGTVLCEGGFSDGSSASGVAMKVMGADDAVLIEGEMGASSEFTFDKPEGAFTVLFDAGEGHKITIPSDEIY
ncbi:hypothetical protein [Phaeovulum vinaykumarii]|uniref:Uncharacterized protein n=1 Tax=Phaeovulum vinaykumarii TaxID=407234 RepID=A0A1N7N697_9RHOB|nr:hypothetical protein [Phaeovulum vinaykumarii]SIS93689.1 hypothetical protein SAMN05421795_1222 [Phaeovulum vinaykumarii]SOC20135.1 hypothetical protein SAMN05878426_1234 [Phaeovulum vinaykumarii]